MIRRLLGADGPAAEALVRDGLGGRRQVRLDAVVDVLALAGVGDWRDDRLVGLATYDAAGAEAELASLAVASDWRRQGVGGGLLEAVVAEVRRCGVGRVWLVTTNDNLAALALYQRHGFRLTAVRPGAVDRARALKPEIPDVAANGIPIRDELLLERQI